MVNYYLTHWHERKYILCEIAKVIERKFGLSILFSIHIIRNYISFVNLPLRPKILCALCIYLYCRITHLHKDVRLSRWCIVNPATGTRPRRVTASTGILKDATRIQRCSRIVAHPNLPILTAYCCRRALVWYRGCVDCHSEMAYRHQGVVGRQKEVDSKGILPWLTKGAY